jgi:hypothetical protein
MMHKFLPSVNGKAHASPHARDKACRSRHDRF